MEQKIPTALYCRLSREDGDRMESDSIGNQRKLLEEYIENHPDLAAVECYADDGYTGTNFQRPAFQRMLRDMESGRIRCVLVKDYCAIILSVESSAPCGASFSVSRRKLHDRECCVTSFRQGGYCRPI